MGPFPVSCMAARGQMTFLHAWTLLYDCMFVVVSYVNTFLGLHSEKASNPNCPTNERDTCGSACIMSCYSDIVHVVEQGESVSECHKCFLFWLKQHTVLLELILIKEKITTQSLKIFLFSKLHCMYCTYRLKI